MLTFVLRIMPYTLPDIARIIGADWLQKGAPHAIIEQLTLDTRHLPLPGDLFFAIIGIRHDGHRFIPQAYEAGFRHFVVSQHVDVAAFPEANFLQAPDTLRALQQLAAFHRSQFDYPVVGITGSNGKTIVKEWLFQLLNKQFNIVRSPKSYNSQVGVPLSIWQMSGAYTLGIFEAGISQIAEMRHLAPIIQPDIGIFTNIGPAHREGFSSEEEKIAEKMQLFTACNRLICCADHAGVMAAAEKWAAAHTGREIWSWSTANLAAMFRVSPVQILDDGHTAMTIQSAGNGETAMIIPFSDSASVENAIHCYVAGLALGVASSILVDGLSHLNPLEMRLELKDGIEDSTLVNDFYNNDLASLRILLQFSQQQAKGRRVTLILSDILQSGQSKQTLYREVAKMIEGIDRFIGIGPAIPAIAPFLPAHVESAFFIDTAAFLGEVMRFSWRNNLILIKGARTFTFELIASRLAQQVHQTRLEINLNALIHNLNVYNSKIQPGVKIMTMVKAAAYGSGGAEVARLLEYHKVDYLGVAYADEGIELRQAGVQLPILVLNPDTASFDVFFRYRLEPEIYSLELLNSLTAYTGTEKAMAIHLKLDTGMHRLGFEKGDMEALWQQLRAFPNLKIASVFTHLSASDNPAHDGFTHHQAAAFSDMYGSIEQVLGYRPLRHVVNTAGIARFPEYHFDMVRLGIGLYGIDSSGLQNRLQVVNVLKTTVSQVKHIPRGDTVGYNRNSGLLSQPRTIATISIGYADGFLRMAGIGRYKVLINNQLAPTIGNVCMDMTMIDITTIPGVKAGDEVVVFGENPPVQHLADCMQTIPYEIFTNISNRVKRVYLQE